MADRGSLDFLTSISLGGDDREPAAVNKSTTNTPTKAPSSKATTPRKKDRSEIASSAPILMSSSAKQSSARKKKHKRSVSTSSSSSQSGSSKDSGGSEQLATIVGSPENQNQKKKSRNRRQSVESSSSEGAVEFLVPKAVARQTLEDTVSNSDSDMELTDIRVTSVSVPKPQYLTSVSEVSFLTDKKKGAEMRKSRDRAKSQSEKDKDKETEKDESAKSDSEEAVDAAESFLKGIDLGVSPEVRKRQKNGTTAEKDKEGDSKMSTSVPSDKAIFPLKKAASVGLPNTSLISLNSRKSFDIGIAAKSKKDAPVEQPRVIEGGKFKLKGTGVLDTRLIYKTRTGHPFLISSLIPIDKLKRKAASQRKPVGDKLAGDAATQEAPPSRTSSTKKRDHQGTSYGQLLEVRREAYDPNLLDHDIAIPDKYKITINLPGYRSTLIPFVKAPDLKKTENEIFQEKHPWLKSNITLSKIRSVKKKIMQIAIARALDIAAVAFSYVYFERLVMKNAISKSNARVMGGVCLLLAEKFYGTKSKSFKHLVETIEKHMNITSKDIAQNEFWVFKELAFSLSAEPAEVVPHLIKLQSTQEYLDHLFEYNAEQRKQIALAQKEAARQRKEASRRKPSK